MTQKGKNMSIYLVFSSIYFSCFSMSKKHMVANYIRFSCRVPRNATIVHPSRTSSRCEFARVIANRGISPWLIDCGPKLNLIAKFFEAKVSIIAKIAPASKELCFSTSIVCFFLYMLVKIQSLNSPYNDFPSIAHLYYD